MRAEEFKDITEVNKKENYIVLFDVKGYKIIMPIISKQTQKKPFFGFDERYGDKIPSEIPDWVSEDMKLRLQNKLFTQDMISIGKMKCVRIDKYGKTEYELDLTKYEPCEPDPPARTIIQWLRDRKDYFTAMVIERLVALKEGDEKRAEELEKAILEYPKLVKTPATVTGTRMYVEEFEGDGIRSAYTLSRKYSVIHQVVVNELVMVEGIDYWRHVNNQTIVFKQPPKGKIVIKYEA